VNHQFGGKRKQCIIMHRALSFLLTTALLTMSLGCSKSTERETPEIGNLQVAVAKTSPPSVTFTFTVEPSKAGVSQEKSECWLIAGTSVRPEKDGYKLWKSDWTRDERNGSFVKVKLSKSAQAKTWTFQINDERNLPPNNYMATSIVLYDDKGNESNELRAWIDYANGRLLEPGAHTKLLVGKWVDEVADADYLRKIIATFNDDGTYLIEGNVKTEKKQSSINEKGAWKVANGIIETNPENPGSDGAAISGAIIFEISDTAFKTYTRERTDGVREWKRVKAE
jgi:hypothetical protein